MNDPHQERQNALLDRIVANAKALNGSLGKLNDRLEDVNTEMNDISNHAKFWSAYRSSTQIYLEATKSFSPPK
ncbi:hypothetical protein O0I10_008658 [Lichtheimia ornata]|uniref:DASH complex subunit DAD4 n=1 Tax=Lichtheimia ornata TaxID=688661 RepID=A0AAD7UYG4_9FUNG|nr:uncharacterized protein O0I10_008658 [Lichtheimia ornata]KAJ8655570.1 hypothetical protein O0I10_008658 [Lichtheimia ornata]